MFDVFSCFRLVVQIVFIVVYSLHFLHEYAPTTYHYDSHYNHPDEYNILTTYLIPFFLLLPHSHRDKRNKQKQLPQSGGNNEYLAILRSIFPRDKHTREERMTPAGVATVNVPISTGGGTGGGGGASGGGGGGSSKGSDRQTDTASASAETHELVTVDLYIVENTSTRELKLIRKLHDLLPCCLSLLMPTMGLAEGM